MTLMPAAVRQRLHEFRIRRRFPGVVVHPGATVDPASRVERAAVLFRNARLISCCLGHHSYVQENSALYNVEVGPFCSIAANVVIGLGNHPTHLVSTSPVFYDSTQPLPEFFVSGTRENEILPRTTIGADVWIGDGARIMSGLVVGTGAVIAAGAVVVRDVEPYAIVGGIPAKILRYRFPAEIRERLLATRWWERSDDWLREHAHTFEDMELFLSRCGG